MDKYEKTQEDEKREKTDLENNPIMRWLQNQDAFKFKPGDILIKKTLGRTWNPQSHSYSEEWVTDVINKNTGAPRKYVYAFENKLGIGYVRQLKVDGSGFTSTLICVANFDPVNTKFEVDPDFIDHTLVGEGDFQYNTEYLNRKKYRQEAIEANKKLLVNTSSDKKLITWYRNLKEGDEFWFGSTFDELVSNKYKIKSITKKEPPVDNPGYGYRITDANSTRKYKFAKKLGVALWTEIECEVLESNHHYMTTGSTKCFVISDFSWKKVSLTKPYPMKDPLCDPQK